MKIIGITLGDPGGIGPEVVLKALPKYLKLQKKGTLFLVIGHLETLQKTERVLGKKFDFKLHANLNSYELDAGKINVLEPSAFHPFEIGAVSRENGKLAFDAVRLGTELAIQKKIQGLMTAPVSKEAVRLSVRNFQGHTEYLAERSQTKSFAMMLQGGPLRVALVTTHIPLGRVAQAITQRAIGEKVMLVHRFLKTELGRDPIIGVAGLNPHAGEGGLIGREDVAIIAPAIKKLQKKRIKVLGPIPGDIIFKKAYQGKLDAIVAMYHDQGLAPLKMVAFEDGINVTLGLPFRRSSPDHGTGFDIAYQNKAHPGSTEKAIEFLL